MDTRDLALFLEVARAGSFAAVARAGGLDPTSVSRAVQRLEEDLGVRLLERSTRALRLTEAGNRWLAEAGPLAEELARLAAEARASRARPEGTLRLSASVTFGGRVILPRLPAFRALHPGIAVEGLFTDANLDLVADRVDLAVRLAPEVEGDVVVAKLMATR